MPTMADMPLALASAPAQAAPALTRQQRLAIFVALLGLAVVCVDGALLTLALPTMARQLQVSASASIWAVNAYQLATLICLLPFSSLGDRLGYRRIYLLGMALFVVGAITASLAPNLPVLVAARGLQGAGAAAIIGLSTAMVRLIFPPERVGRGIAINSMVIALSSVAGPSLAALVLAVAHWRWLFLICLPLTAVVLLLGPKVLPGNRNPATSAPLSWVDVGLNALVCALLFIGADLLVIRPGAGAAAGAQGAVAINWPLLGLGMIAASLVVGRHFLRRLATQAAPLFPVDLMRMPTFALAAWATVAACTGLALVTVAVPFMLQDAFGRTPLQAGLLMTAWPAAIFLVAPWVGRLIGRVHTGVLGGTGMLTMALGMATLALLPAQPADWDIAWRLGLAGAGFGMFQAPNNHAIITSAPAQRAGVASGMVGTTRIAGMTLGAVLLTQIFAKWPPSHLTGPTIAIWAGVAFALLAAACSTARMRLR